LTTQAIGIIAATAFLPWAALVADGVVLNKDGRIAEIPNKMGTSSLA
jgi:type IV secretory pathway VirB4 component